jgi:sulfite reductase alpha subunit-like flavoprotein
MRRYNYAHRKLYNRLRQLGAEEFCLRGESDEQHPDGMEGSWIPWASGLKQTLLELYPLPPDLEPLPDGEFLTPEWQLELGEGSAELDMPQPTCTKSSHADQSTTPSIATADHTLLGASGPVDSTSARSSANDSITPPGQFLATVMQNERVTPRNHWQDVRLFEFTTPPIDYLPGDVLTIYPHNHSSSVDQLIQLMNWQSIADKSLRFTPSTSSTSPASPPPLPSSSSAKDRLTLRSLLSQHLDLNAIPRRSFFASLAHFTTDQFQHDRLIEFTAPEYVDEFFDYATRPRRSIIEVLHEFDTVKLPWNWIADILPAIRGRQFSIASGGALKKTEDGQGNIELLIAMVKYRTVIKKIREGLCSRYMSLLKPGDELTVLLCKGGMKINMDRPAILIGPGTGIAPLRSMLLERAQFQTEHPGMQKQKQILFFGNRNIEADYFFEEDWRSLREELDLDVFTAFSRDQVCPAPISGENIRIDVPRRHRSFTFKTSSSNNRQRFIRCSKRGIYTSAGERHLSLPELICPEILTLS